ncbi:hypothetical protein HMPREF1207_05070 [Paenibacillus sp. HGH0039]|nr:hypothetical protein HMPREF1207_05070 [Paenibacillus sp. HGH0039]
MKKIFESIAKLAIKTSDSVENTTDKVAFWHLPIKKKK